MSSDSYNINDIQNVPARIDLTRIYQQHSAYRERFIHYGVKDFVLVSITRRL